MAYRLPHLGLTLFGGLGLFLAGASLGKRLLPTIVTAALIAVFHSLTIVSARFHIPLEPLLGIWGAAGLVHSRRICVFGERCAVARSAAARDHVVGVGIKDRLAVSHRV